LPFAPLHLSAASIGIQMISAKKVRVYFLLLIMPLMGRS
jgi:hypothetical protein